MVEFLKRYSRQSLERKTLEEYNIFCKEALINIDNSKKSTISSTKH